MPQIKKHYTQQDFEDGLCDNRGRPIPSGTQPPQTEKELEVSKAEEQQPLAPDGKENEGVQTPAEPDKDAPQADSGPDSEPPLAENAEKE